MPALPQIDPVSLVKAAQFELDAAVSQMIAGDDAIIREKIEKARALLQQILNAA